jgi:Sulfotransferase family
VIISHAKRFVILAPWKTASSTIRTRLGSYCESPYSTFFEFNPILKRVVHQHMTYADFAALPESRLGYFTAAFVRNPYDRVYSGFNQLQKDLREQPAAPFPSPGVRDLVMRQLAENFAQLSQAGFSFECWFDLVDPFAIYDAGRNTNFPLHPAHYWTHYNREQAVDFIGRVETFERDFHRLCQALGIEPDNHANANTDVGESQLAGDHNGYRYVERMSSRARQKVNDVFREDFELFG